MKLRTLLLLVLLFLPGQASMREATRTPNSPWANSASHSSRVANRTVSPTIFDLSAFGAVGDGVADDGPALQSALDAIANAGGGTLFVPAGRYAINTPVVKNFAGLADSVTIQGVESSTPVPPPTATGNELSRGLDLVSEFAPRTGQLQNAITISGLESFLIKDLVFIGTPGVDNDALITLALNDISSATIRHCEFYGLSSLVAGGAIVQAVRSDLTFEQSVVLGSACSSGVYSSIIQNLQWKGITISEAIFIDYGQRPELYGKMTSAPFSWVSIGNAAATDNDSPRREAVVRSVFLDEGGYMGLSSLTYLYSPPSAPIDLLYITNLFMNVSNFGTTGHYLYGLERVMVENSHYGWSHNADSAISLLSVGNAIIDEAECVAGANRIRADSATGKLTVINSIYTHLDSAAQTTDVVTTATPEEDPVQHVRQQFVSTLGREPDAAAHFHWSDQILQCGADTVCATARRAALATYLASAPAQKFAVSGHVTDESGASLPGVTVTLSGSQSVTTTTDSAGQYHFSNLPTSGVYTVTPTLNHHTLDPISHTIVTPAGDQVFDASATFNYHVISGRAANAAGAAIPGVTVTLSGTQEATVTTDANGNYSFGNLPAGGNYTVTPRKTSYAFSPANRTFPDLGADQTLNFTATFVTYTVAGIVVGPNNNPMSGIVVTLSGSQNGTTTSDSSGNFYFNETPSEGNYTVTPALIGYSFSPSSRTYNNLAANQYHSYSGTYTTHSISGRVTDAASGTALPGAVVTLSGYTSGTTTTDANGNYNYNNLPRGGAYTVTVAKVHYTFAQASQTFTNLTSNQTANYAATLNRHSITGLVTGSGGTGIAGATVTLSGTQTSTTTTDSNGAYAFANLPAGGGYTVRPSKTSYTWTPQSLAFNDLGSNQTASFTGTYVSYNVSGRVTENGTGLSGVSVQLSGSQTSTTTTDAGGSYSFNLASEGNYTVTPSKQHYTFTPGSLTFNNLVANQTADFAATRDRHTISGRIFNINNTGEAGITVSLSGSQTATATTNSTGDYSFTNLAAEGNYTVTPTLQYHSFTPSSQTYTNLVASQQGSFVVTLNTHTISGRLTDPIGSPIAGATVALSGSLGPITTMTTGADGNYSFGSLPAGSSYVVAVSKFNRTFNPASRSFNTLNSNQTADFTGTLISYSVSGRVTENGTGLIGVSVQLTGSQASTTITDAGGNYSFSLTSEGSYTVTPSKQHYTFTPGSLTFNNLVAAQTADFAATRNRHTISGGIVNINGAGLAGVTVSLSGSQTATATTDSNGDFSFANLAAEGNYTVSPSLQYHSFTPASRTFTNLVASQQGSFVATLNTHTISGRLSDASGSPIAGAVVTLSGSSVTTATITTGADGTYSFASLPAGASYVVTVSKVNYDFNPASRSFSALNSNQTADFSATLHRVIEFTVSSYSAMEGMETITLTVLRSGDTSAEATVFYSAADGTAHQGDDLSTIIGQITFAPGETSQTFTIFITDDAFVENAEQLTVTLTDPEGATLGSRVSAVLTINDNDSGAANPNPVDDAEFFVRQHYRDFLNREPDAAGLSFWSDQIEACGTNAACREDRRINVSAAFFLSIEFQETGFFVHRLYQASFAQPPRYLDEFLLDTRTISQGVVVNAPGWQQLLEDNKTAMVSEFVERPDFMNQYPLTLTPAEFVNSLNARAGGPLTAAGLAAAVAEFNGSTTSSETVARARVLRLVVENETFSRRELSPAFVLMQYFGYLQRNPSDPPDINLDGYNFWLSKLNQFGGDFHQAQMVKSFLVSGEYRSRFGL